MTNEKTRSILVAWLAVAMLPLAACDSSKAELDRTKQTLSSVTAERDNLKAQLEQERQRSTQLQQQVTDLQSRAQAAAPEAGSTSAAGRKQASTRRPTKSAPAAEAAPARTPEQQERARQVDKKANTGGGHF
jgi:cell division protein FtsB